MRDNETQSECPVHAAPVGQHARGELFVVSLPIGNPEDITLRALRILRSVSAICCEDTRVSQPQLNDYGIQTPLLSLQVRAEYVTLQAVKEKITSGLNVAVISDCGTPLIADPGLRVIQTVLSAGGNVTAVPGPSAVLAALAASGFRTAPFYFAGFPPRGVADRPEFFKSLCLQSGHIVLFEGQPYLRDSLRNLVNELGADRPAALAQHLTTVREIWIRGTLGSILAKTGTKVRRSCPCTLVISAPI